MKNAKPLSRKDYSLPKSVDYIKWGVRFPLLIFLILGFVYGMSKIGDWSCDWMKESWKKAQVEKVVRRQIENEIAYRVLVMSGYGNLAANHLDFAQAEFVRALKVNEHGKKARIGLTKVLVRKCNLLNEYCAEAELNIKFIEEMNCGRLT